MISQIFESIFEARVPNLSLQMLPTGWNGWTSTRTNARSMDTAGLAGLAKITYTIFEGTSEIQRLIIARAISGLHIR